jgi:hypothetical protein
MRVSVEEIFKKLENYNITSASAVISVDISHVHASISMVQVAICLINAP